MAGIKIDPTINVSEIVTILILLISFAVGYSDLKSADASHDVQIQNIQSRQDRDFAVVELMFQDVKGQLNRIENKLDKKQDK